MPNPPAIDALELARDLVRRPSVTPADAGALGVLEGALGKLGFTCHRLAFGEGEAKVENLYARIGSQSPNFCYAGHTDVVPVGDVEAWSVDPFGAEVVDGVLYGRGAADMKSAIACFVAATERFLAARGGEVPGSISLLITGDEEGTAINGTIKVLEWLAERGETIDVCLLGEPTSRSRLGDMIKIGRRGSMNGRLTVHGTQGHAAYPERADNPVPRLLEMLAAVSGTALDEGTEHFQPSNLEITTIDVGNPAANVIPARAHAAFNIRFNDRHTSESLTTWLRARCDEVGGAYDLDVEVSGEAFLTPPGAFSDLVAGAVREIVGVEPELGTAGGTSDARFIKDHCPVVEFGLVGESMHGVDERVAIAALDDLADIYYAVLKGYLSA